MNYVSIPMTSTLSTMRPAIDECIAPAARRQVIYLVSRCGKLLSCLLSLWTPDYSQHVMTGHTMISFCLLQALSHCSL